MKKADKILVVDDDPAMRSLLTFRLEAAGYQIETFSSAEEVQEKLKTDFHYDLILLDVMLPRISGMELLKNIKHEYANSQIVIMTAYPSVKIGVDAIKSGAYDFICKPFDIDQLLITVNHALENSRLKQDNLILRQSIKPPAGFSDLIGESPRMKEIRALIRQSASSRATVLITGDSGTGKEVTARMIHQNSVLHQGNFVAVNCGAIPRNLIESELFGHEKGAFTGATSRKKGKFEQAENGTIFLDEIGELPLEDQVKLLRVLQEKEVVRVGGDESIKLNVRVIAATNRGLPDMIKEGKFREDLYYRLALLLIDLPPLRQRGKDILLLADYFLKKNGDLENKQDLFFNRGAEKFLLDYTWPGNIRELDNCICRTVLMNPTQKEFSAKDIQLLPSIEKAAGDSPLFSNNEISSLKVIEAKAIEEALKITKGNVCETAKQLEISRVTLYRKIDEYGIEKGNLTK